MTQDISSTPAESDPCMWGNATLVTLVSRTCITVTIITERVMAHFRKGESGSVVAAGAGGLPAGGGSRSGDTGSQPSRTPREWQRLGLGARVQPWVADQRPVVDPVDRRHRRGGGRLGAPLARREPDELLRGRAAGTGRLDLGAAGPALATLRLPRPLGVLLGLALIFLAAAVAAVHPWSFLSHPAPFSLTLLYMTREVLHRPRPSRAANLRRD